MTPEEAKRELEFPCQSCAGIICEKHESCVEYQAYRLAVEAIEKQIPRKVGFDKHYGVYVCPDCGKELYPDKAACWCHFCGKKVDWSEET